MAGNDPPDRELSDVLLDLLLYAPIGLVLDAETVTPDLARRGRQNAAAARQIGEMAVKRGLARLDEVLAQMEERVAEPSRSVRTGTAPHDAGGDDIEPVTGDDATSTIDDEAAAGPPAAALAIPDYDLLAASQVVKRLDGLTAAELEAVRQYESASRDRRTILHKIARLQG